MQVHFKSSTDTPLVKLSLNTNDIKENKVIKSNLSTKSIINYNNNKKIRSEYSNVNFNEFYLDPNIRLRENFKKKNFVSNKNITIINNNNNFIFNNSINYNKLNRKSNKSLIKTVVSKNNEFIHNSNKNSFISNIDRSISNNKKNSVNRKSSDKNITDLYNEFK